ncbi:MAG: ABC transporter ATP-binding protein [Candidatus Aerophobetes bacterium]|nr:ABC transporter ATP-binding protein [Candidatus Aerophobetes bacterium]
MAGLTVKGLTKKYGETRAVENLYLKVKDKEFVVLVGPSGCGKTTVLNSIAGLIEINEGEIWFGDELVTSPEQGISKIPQKREVAMVFQDYAIYPHMTVFGNIAFPLEIRKVNKHEIEARVKKTAQLLKIDNLLNRKPTSLSGGQRQRIALGRAIVRGPKIFLMDEPLANLDAKLRVHARVELKKLQQELGVTTIFVTHDQVEAMTMGDRIAVMNEGHLEQMGTSTELYHNPRSKFVAGFIGSPPMNMLDGSLVEKNGNIVIDLEFSIYVLPKRMKELMKRATPSEVTLGVRPENIVIMKKSQKNSFEAKVVHIEPMGRESNVYLEAGGNPFIAIRDSTQDLKAGDEVWLSFDKEKIHIFDRKSGGALL